MNSVVKLPVAVREAAGLVPAAARAFGDILRPELTREDVLERIDEDELRSAPLNLLVATAVAITAPDAAPYAEDAALRYVTALTDRDTAEAAFLRVSAEKLVLADVEYQASLATYHTAEQQAPSRGDWVNPQHYLEAAKIHERRMDRLLRVRKEAFERWARAAEVYQAALGRAARVPASLGAAHGKDSGVPERDALSAESGTAVHHSDTRGDSPKYVQVIIR